MTLTQEQFREAFDDIATMADSSDLDSQATAVDLVDRIHARAKEALALLDATEPTTEPTAMDALDQRAVLEADDATLPHTLHPTPENPVLPVRGTCATCRDDDTRGSTCHMGVVRPLRLGGEPPFGCSLWQVKQ